MKIVSLIARILLGLMFTVFGLNGFLHFIPAPPLPDGVMKDFVTAVFVSHYYVLVFGVQTIAGILLLANQYVPLALVALAAVLANIFTFHITMQPAGIVPGLIAFVLWLLVAIPLRAHFEPLLARKTTAS